MRQLVQAKQVLAQTLCTNLFDVTHVLEHSYDLCAREPSGTHPPKLSSILNRTGLHPDRLLLLESPCPRLPARRLGSPPLAARRSSPRSPHASRKILSPPPYRHPPQAAPARVVRCRFAYPMRLST